MNAGSYQQTVEHNETTPSSRIAKLPSGKGPELHLSNFLIFKNKIITVRAFRVLNGLFNIFKPAEPRHKSYFKQKTKVQTF